MSGGKRPEDTVGTDGIQMTVRFNPVIHHYLTQEAERTGISLNTLVNRACSNAMAPPGGSAKIARIRRRLIPRPQQVQAALALVMSYLGRGSEAKRLWPGALGPFPGAGTLDDLAVAGAFLAAEIDAPTLQAGRTVTGAR